MKPTVDYSLYLVTDSTPAVLGSNNLVQVVEKALKGGVTIVQYREKTADTGEQIQTAKRLHEVTKRYNVPLLINDRVDVALAVGCEGVHIGQDDIDPRTARKLLGDSAIIGVTVSSKEEALKACEDGADYLGIGTIFSTATKANAKDIIGTSGCQSILEALAPKYASISTVCIGGINKTNLQRVLYQSATENKKLDGVALVSAIISAKDAEETSRELVHLVRTPPPFVVSSRDAQESGSLQKIIDGVNSVLSDVNSKKPLSHNMTNLVVQNFAANVALAIGASPIMANSGVEAADLSKLGGALVINMGTVTEDGLKNYLLATGSYNEVGAPIVFDPVGAAATALRRKGVRVLMAGAYFDVIKGNEGEIRQVAGQAGVQQRGVDSGESNLDDETRAKLVAELAKRERNIVVMTGPTDFVSDGKSTFAIRNGHDYLERVTGTGCVLGTIISAALAAHREDKLLATIAGMLHFEIAAEFAAVRDDVKGPGTFMSALIDELDHIRKMGVAGDISWLEKAKVTEYKNL